MKNAEFAFTSELEKIGAYLYETENINHADVVHTNFTSDTGIFEDRSSGSFVYFEFADREGKQISKIQFRLEDGGGVIEAWVDMFRREFGAGIKELG